MKALEKTFKALGGAKASTQIAKLCKAEDYGKAGDITSASLLGSERATASVVLREPGVVAGLRTLKFFIPIFSRGIRVKLLSEDGEVRAAGEKILSLSGPSRALLGLERSLLNLLSHLCGIATLARQYVKQVEGTSAEIFDTRKTKPGLRVLEKYAVKCGGAENHRFGLFDAILIKDNHLAKIPANKLVETLERKLKAARKKQKPKFIELEVDTPDQFEQALRFSAGTLDAVLLDNFALDQLEWAVAQRNARSPSLLLEASGGVQLDRVRAIAKTGVNRISVGSLTHSAKALDLSLEFDHGL